MNFECNEAINGDIIVTKEFVEICNKESPLVASADAGKLELKGISHPIDCEKLLKFNTKKKQAA